MTSPPHTRHVVAAVVRRGARYLLCQRALGTRHGGLWEFPGGKLEAGEDHLMAARRELREELDLKVTSGGELLHSEVDPASSFIIDFVAIDVEGEPHCHEHMAYDWVEVQEIARLELAPADERFAQRLSA
ncbi:MAG: NUDIX domain-containing protein [Deltaproteobacteria bacterium]|nr:NUDIX domain-containing protein [Deltaproteobacteria bacterium]